MAGVTEDKGRAVVHVPKLHERLDGVADLPEAEARDVVSFHELLELRTVVADMPEDEGRAAVHRVQLITIEPVKLGVFELCPKAAPAKVSSFKWCARFTPTKISPSGPAKRSAFPPCTKVGPAKVSTFEPCAKIAPAKIIIITSPELGKFEPCTKIGPGKISTFELCARIGPRNLSTSGPANLSTFEPCTKAGPEPMGESLGIADCTVSQLGSSASTERGRPCAVLCEEFVSRMQPAMAGGLIAPHEHDHQGGQQAHEVSPVHQMLRVDGGVHFLEELPLAQRLPHSADLCVDELSQSATVGDGAAVEISVLDVG